MDFPNNNNDISEAYLKTVLLHRKNDTHTAAMLGIWVHGYAGDCLTRECTAEAYDGADLIERLKEGFVKLYR